MDYKEYTEDTEKSIRFLYSAIKNNELILYYQPIVDARTEETVGAEALVRKIGSDGNVISPREFVPLLERTGYIQILDRYVADKLFSFLLWIIH